MSARIWLSMVVALWCMAGGAVRAAEEPAKAAPGKPSAADAPNDDKEKRDTTPIRVLFVGDELTEKGHLGQLVTRMAQAAKEPRRFYSEDIGSANSTLERHAKGDAFWNRIGGQRWDYVVLQEDSRVIQRYPGATTRFARELDRSIRKRRAETVLFSPWAPQDPPDGHAQLAKAYDEVAAAIRAKVLPVGRAWQEAGASAKDIPLYLSDKRYASPQGEYLTACVFYAFFYDKSPEQLPTDLHKGVKADEAKSLQAIAWKVVQESKKVKPPQSDVKEKDAKEKTPVKPASPKPAPSETPAPK